MWYFSYCIFLKYSNLFLNCKLLKSRKLFHSFFFFLLTFSLTELLWYCHYSIILIMTIPIIYWVLAKDTFLNNVYLLSLLILVASLWDTFFFFQRRRWCFSSLLKVTCYKGGWAKTGTQAVWLQGLCLQPPHHFL